MLRSDPILRNGCFSETQTIVSLNFGRGAGAKNPPKEGMVVADNRDSFKCPLRCILQNYLVWMGSLLVRGLRGPQEGGE